ncbi:hypothetical protein GA0115259_106961, partial [Streptomyces sp. MnatMP-M17]
MSPSTEPAAHGAHEARAVPVKSGPRVFRLDLAGSGSGVWCRG